MSLLQNPPVASLLLQGPDLHIGPAGPLWSGPHKFPISAAPLATLASLLALKHIRQASASEPLQMIFPPFDSSLYIHLACTLTSLKSLFTCHLLVMPSPATFIKWSPSQHSLPPFLLCFCLYLSLSNFIFQSCVSFVICLHQLECKLHEGRDLCLNCLATRPPLG